MQKIAALPFALLSSLAGSNYMAPTAFEVIKGVGQPGSSEAGPSKVDRITINLPKELIAQSEILIFLRDHPVRSKHLLFCVCLSVCLSVRLSVCVSVCVFHASLSADHCCVVLHCSEVGPLSSYILRLRYPRMGSLPHWEQQLYSAQSVLFNKELLTKVGSPTKWPFLAAPSAEFDGDSTIKCLSTPVLILSSNTVVLWDVSH